MIFVVYSWLNDKPDEKVLQLVADLRINGYDALCDVMKMQEESAINFAEMMATCLRQAEKVIVVLSERYKEKADTFRGGLSEEYRYIINDISHNKNKYILVTFSNDLDKVVPDFLKGRNIIYCNGKIADNTDLLHKLNSTQKYVFPEVNPVKTKPVPVKINSDPAEPGRAYDTVNVNISIVVPKVEFAVDYFVLHVKDGMDEWLSEKDKMPVNKQIEMKSSPDKANIYTATISTYRSIGFQFKCFAKCAPEHIDELVDALRTLYAEKPYYETVRGRYPSVSKGSHDAFVWFILPEYHIYETKDTLHPFLNNYYHHNIHRQKEPV